MSNIAKEKANPSVTMSQIEHSIKINESPTYLFIKRSVDIIGALLGIAILLLVFIIVSVAIKAGDPKGPVFFSQKRIGKNGKIFKMYKFRSMVANAEDQLEELLKFNEVSGAMFKMKEDPRVTSIGRFIRKTSIDELPQLWNVVKGDMSIVGPRPPLLSEVKQYSDYDKQRLLVQPGCTGLWQVSGRSNLDFPQMVQLDLKYIQNRSFLLDMKIIFKTFRVLLGSKDAF